MARCRRDWSSAVREARAPFHGAIRRGAHLRRWPGPAARRKPRTLARRPAESAGLDLLFLARWLDTWLTIRPQDPACDRCLENEHPVRCIDAYRTTLADVISNDPVDGDERRVGRGEYEHLREHEWSAGERHSQLVDESSFHDGEPGKTADQPPLSEEGAGSRLGDETVGGICLLTARIDCEVKRLSPWRHQSHYGRPDPEQVAPHWTGRCVPCRLRQRHPPRGIIDPDVEPADDIVSNDAVDPHRHCRIAAVAKPDVHSRGIDDHRRCVRDIHFAQLQVRDDGWPRGYAPSRGHDLESVGDERFDTGFRRDVGRKYGHTRARIDPEHANPAVDHGGNHRRARK